MTTIRLILGDCVEVMREMPDGSIGGSVNDPPYGLSFMGKKWDDLSTHHEMTENHRIWLAEVFRLLPSGGIIKVFSATRTFHRLAVAMENVGFEGVGTKMEAWCYGSGFPKSMNLSKAIDKHLGKSDDREVVGVKPGHEEFAGRTTKGHITAMVDGAMGQEGGFARPWMEEAESQDAYHLETKGATDEAKKFEGYGTALKPAWEPILVGVKP